MFDFLARWKQKYNDEMLGHIDEDRRPHRAEQIAPMAQLMGEVNDARLPWWRRERYGVPTVLWIGLLAAGGFALYLHFKFPPF